MGNNICVGKKAIVEICLVPESKKASNERIEVEIKETLRCDWLGEIQKITVKIEQ